jgi:hypothetical protein
MNSFDFFKFFLEFCGPRTIFIGGWGTKFNFFRIFLNFLDIKQLKYDQIYIQIVEFIFKRLNLNSNRSVRS